MSHVHMLPSNFRNQPIYVHVVGCGGTGSSILMGLPYLHQALKVWGHPYGLRVTAIDPDTVSSTNCVRQPFALSDIGQYKAEVLISRLNQFWGFDWAAITKPYDKAGANPGSIYSSGWTSTITIGCVDSRKSRHQILSHTRSGYWLDFGNGSSHGQFVLGQFPSHEPRRSDHIRLPLVTELFSEIADVKVPEENLPSCSAIEAIERQEPFVNQALATAGLSMLTQLLRYGQIGYHGGFFNAKTGVVSPLKVDEDVWRRMQGKRKRYPRRATVMG